MTLSEKTIGAMDRCVAFARILEKATPHDRIELSDEDLALMLLPVDLEWKMPAARRAFWFAAGYGNPFKVSKDGGHWVYERLPNWDGAACIRDFWDWREPT